MKHFFPSLIFFLFLQVLSSKAQVQYQFNIDKQPYFVEESKLNDIFGMALNDLMSSGTAKQKSYDLWIKTFNLYKLQSMNGTHNWDVYYDKIVNLSFSNGKPGDITGLNQDGKTAKGNPNKEGSWNERMAYINYLMSKYITNTYTTKKIR